MKISKILLPIVICLFGTSCAYSQDQEVVIKVDSLSSSVYMLTGQGGNIGIYVGEEYVFMIDDQFDRLSDKIKATIATLSNKPLAFLFNTHMHGDHTGGNAKFNEGHTKIVAHDNVRKRLDANKRKDLENKKISKEYYLKMLPEVTFSKDITFHDGEETIRAFHVEHAHTDGDALVYFLSNNVIHMGDTYFAGRYPYIDLKSGGSVSGLIAAQKKALAAINDGTVIIPGHGRPSNKKELGAYIAMLETLKERMLTVIAKGSTLEQVMADAGIGAGYDTDFGGGFINPERMRQIFYNSLKGN